MSLTESTGGQNFDYVKRGGVRKRAGHTKLNSSADTQTRSLGIGLWNKPGSTREVIRAGNRKLQNFDPNSFSFTNLTEDTTTAGSDFFAASTTVPVVSAMFNTASVGTLWHVGGGATAIYGAYSDSKVTKNGVPAPTTSAFTATGAGSGTGPAAGTYRYTLVYRKASTQALSNALTATEASVTASGTESVTLAWTLSNNDTTKYDKIYVYRSSAGGATGFTAGALLAILNSSATGYTDDNTIVSSSEVVPRAGSASLDNSEPPAGTPSGLCVFKRRLVTAIGSTVYFSDINKPESWPTYQFITVPSGGAITGLGVITLATPTSPEVDEFLVVFKQREVWVITGTGDVTNLIPDWSLKYINSAGAPNQNVVVTADGYLLWVNYRGFYMWNGAGKPRYISRKIQDKFERGGEIDKSQLPLAWGMYIENRGEVQWCLSSTTAGTQKLILKLDLSLTEGASTDATGNPSMDGVFTPDNLSFSAYAGSSVLLAANSTEESVYYGDASGFIYGGYLGVQDDTTSFDFDYITPYLNFGTPNINKRVAKVVAWVIDNGTYDFKLTYWTNYLFRSEDGQVVTQRVNQGSSSTGAVYGTSVYGTATYDSFSPRLKPVVFNLLNAEGDSVRLRFSQIASPRTLTLYGFSVYYNDSGLRK